MDVRMTPPTAAGKVDLITEKLKAITKDPTPMDVVAAVMTDQTTSATVSLKKIVLTEVAREAMADLPTSLDLTANSRKVVVVREG